MEPCTRKLIELMNKGIDLTDALEQALKEPREEPDELPSGTDLEEIKYA
jgi:hypothetical protein